MGIRGKVSRSTIAYANENRDWRIYCDFAQILIHQARNLYADDDFDLQLQETVYALDATIIDLCLSVFPWARFRILCCTCKSQYQFTTTVFNGCG